MPVPNKFETAILKAAVSAQKFHIEMTGVYNLRYSHESFLQNYIAIEMFKQKGFYVYVDASPKKIHEDADSVSRRQPKSDKRFDLVFWQKTKNQVRAIIEIKRTWYQGPVIKDVGKLLDYIPKKDAGGAAGYVLYYTTNNDKQLIIDRFHTANDTMRNKLSLHGLTHPVDSYIFQSGDDFRSGFALFRC